MPYASLRSKNIAAIVAVVALSFSVSLAAHAAPVSGDLVKLADDGNVETTADSAVYYVGGDGKRYAFPNGQAYFTWYADFSGVKVVSPADLASLPLGGNITYRPGTRLVKIVSDPKVYAVEPNGTLRPIASEAVAKALYGDAWSRRVDDVPDAFFVNYTLGEPLGAAVYPTGAVVKRVSDGVHFRIENGTKRKIPSAAVSIANRIQSAHVLETSSSLSEYPDGTDVAAADPAIVDTAQKNAAPLVTIPTFRLRALPTAYVAIGADSVFIDVGIVSPQPVTVRKLAVKVRALTNDPADPALDDDKGGLVLGNNAQSNLTVLRIVDEIGAEPFGRKEIARDVTLDQEQTFTFDGVFAVPAGTEKRLRFMARLNPLLPVGQGYAVTLVATGTQVVDGSGQTVAFAPAEDIVGPTLSTLNVALEVSAAATPGLQSYVRGSLNAAIAGFTFKATTVAPNIINAVSFQGYVDEEGAGGFLPGVDTDNGTETRVRQVFPELSLYDNATSKKIAGPSPVSLDGRVAFTGLSYGIPAGQSATLVLKGDIPKILDVEDAPDRVSFDVADPAGDVSVVDERGGKVQVVGVNLNKGVAPVYYGTVKASGSMEFKYAGGGGSAIAGTEVIMGTLTLAAKDDDYDVRSLAFVRPATQSAAVTALRLEYPDATGAKASVTADVVGNGVAFSNLPLVVLRDKPVILTVYGKIRPRDAGAVYGDTVGFSFSEEGPLQLVSKSTLLSFSESAIGAELDVASNVLSTWRVRFSALTAAKSTDSPTLPIYRSSDQDVLHFTLKADPAGGVRVRKMTFKLEPSDVGREGSNNDALERWARVNGDFPEDDSVIALRRVYPDQPDPVIGVGSSGHINYSIVSAGTKSSVSSTIDSAAGNYGLVEVEFDDSAEYSIAAGETATFSLSIDGSAFSDVQDFTLGVSLLSAGDFLWTDIPYGSYTPLTGTDATGTGLSTTVVVKK